MARQPRTGAADPRQQGERTRRAFARRRWARRWLGWRRALVALAVLVLLGVGSYAVYFSSWLALDRVEVVGVDHLTVEQVTRASNLWTMSLFMANNSAALQRLQSSGVKLMEFPDAVWDAFGAAAKEVIEEPMGDELYKKCYDSYMASMESSATWIARSEGTFTAQRNRVMGL